MLILALTSVFFSINDPNKRPFKEYGSLVPNARPLHDTPSSFSAQQGMGIDTAPLSLGRPTNGRARTFFFFYQGRASTCTYVRERDLFGGGFAFAGRS